MKLELEITNVDGTEDVVKVTPRTQVAYEEAFKTNLDGDVGMKGIYWLAWHSAKSNKKFNEWLDGIEGVTPIDDDEESDDDRALDPLVETAPSGESLPSPSNQAQESPISN